MKKVRLRRLLRFVLVLMLATIMIALVVAYFVPLKLQLMSTKQTHAAALKVAIARVAGVDSMLGTAPARQDAWR